jgi:hypothetical protein
MLSKKEYLDIRHSLTTGYLDEKGIKLFYEYWVIFKEESYQEVDFDTFAQTFTQYLSIGNNYFNAIERTLEYFDVLYGLIKVSDAKTGETLALK